MFNLILELEKKKKNKIEKFNFIDLKLKLFSLKMLISFLIIFVFCVFYVGFLKILRLLKDSKYIDLNLIKQKIIYLSCHYNLNLSYILVFVLSYILILRTLRSLMFLFLKKKILSLSYFLIINNNNYFSFYSKFTIIHIILFFYITDKLFFSKKIIKRLIIFSEYFFKYIGYVLLVLGLIIDLIFNNYILIYFSTILPWFSLYQMLYRLHDFLSKKIDIQLEYLVASSIYVKELHDKKLRREFEQTERKFVGGYALYKNISINMLGDVPPEISTENRLLINNYLKNLLE